MERKAERDTSRKLKVVNHTIKHDSISKACCYFGVCRETFYTGRRAYGDNALINTKPCPENHKLGVLRLIEDKIVYLRPNYHFETRYDCLAFAAIS